MNWTQIFKNAIIAAVGTPILFWVLVQVVGDSNPPATSYTYLIAGAAGAVGSMLGEILRQRSKK